VTESNVRSVTDTPCNVTSTLPITVRDTATSCASTWSDGALPDRRLGPNRSTLTSTSSPPSPASRIAPLIMGAMTAGATHEDQQRDERGGEQGELVEGGHGDSVGQDPPTAARPILTVRMSSIPVRP